MAFHKKNVPKSVTCLFEPNQAEWFEARNFSWVVLLIWICTLESIVFVDNLAQQTTPGVFYILSMFGPGSPKKCSALGATAS